MRPLKKLLVAFVSVMALYSCSEDDTSYALNDVSAPSNVQGAFDIASDDSGTVSVTPTAEGVSVFQIYFGDEESETPTEVSPGETVEHTYAEGEFTLRIVAVGGTGLTSELSRIVTISFAPPTDLLFEVTPSATNPLEVSVTPTATGATVFEVFFGDSEDEEATIIMAGETATYTYAEAGDYTVKVIARGAGAAGIESLQAVSVTAGNTAGASDFIGTWRMASEAGSLGVGPAPGDISWFAIDEAGVEQRACYFDDTYVFGADGSFSNVLGAETWVEAWQGIAADACSAPVAPHDGSAEASYSYNEEEGTLTLEGTGAYLGIPKANNAGELPGVEVPESITYTATLSEDNTVMNLLIETGEGVFWQFKLVKDAPPAISPLEGTWVMAPEAGSLGVGPALGDISWFAIDEAGVEQRACYFDDTYVFDANGTFTNRLGNETWLEAWQGVAEDSCGAPVAPHDGTTPATYSYDQTAGTITLNGTGAYIGLPKANNEGELPNVAVPESIVYDVTFADENTMNVSINVSIDPDAPVFWQFKLIKPQVVESPLAGSWKMANEVASLGVGPAIGDTSWFAIDEAGLTQRACYFDDSYVFRNDGSFSNELGDETWLETWQGVDADTCGAPVAPHDGSTASTYSYDETAGTLTVSGAGAYIGLPKAINEGELPNVAVPDAIVYNVIFADDDTMNLSVNVSADAGAPIFWQYKLVRE